MSLCHNGRMSGAGCHSSTKRLRVRAFGKPSQRNEGMYFEYEKVAPKEEAQKSTEMAGEFDWARQARAISTGQRKEVCSAAPQKQSERQRAPARPPKARTAPAPLPKVADASAAERNTQDGTGHGANAASTSTNSVIGLERGAAGPNTEAEEATGTSSEAPASAPPRSASSRKHRLLNRIRGSTTEASPAAAAAAVESLEPTSAIAATAAAAAAAAAVASASRTEPEASVSQAAAGEKLAPASVVQGTPAASSSAPPAHDNKSQEGHGGASSSSAAASGAAAGVDVGAADLEVTAAQREAEEREMLASLWDRLGEADPQSVDSQVAALTKDLNLDEVLSSMREIMSGFTDQVAAFNALTTPASSADDVNSGSSAGDDVSSASEDSEEAVLLRLKREDPELYELVTKPDLLQEFSKSMQNDRGVGDDALEQIARLAVDPADARLRRTLRELDRIDRAGERGAGAQMDDDEDDDEDGGDQDVEFGDLFDEINEDADLNDDEKMQANFELQSMFNNATRKEEEESKSRSSKRTADVVDDMPAVIANPDDLPMPTLARRPLRPGQ